jgi:hypothetical protein
MPAPDDILSTARADTGERCCVAFLEMEDGRVSCTIDTQALPSTSVNAVAASALEAWNLAREKMALVRQRWARAADPQTPAV